jgi:hypothetical protein
VPFDIGEDRAMDGVCFMFMLYVALVALIQEARMHLMRR